jgi:sensor histidine kinase YesM
MNLSLNGKSLLLWLRPSCWSREKLRMNLLGSLLLIICLIVFGFSFSALIYFIYASTGNPVAWKQALSVGLTQWWAWCFLYSLVFWLTRRFPIERQRWWRGALFYSLISVVIVALKLGLDVVLIRLVYEGEVFKQIPERSLLAMMLYFNFLTWGALVGVGHALNFYRQMRERELKASQLEAQLAQAHLQSLKMQLQPHFLFNTLHTIAMLNLKDPKAANRMLSRLSDLLRLSLESVGVQEVTLKQELDFLKQYLEIQQVRFQDRLSVHLEIDPESLDAQVPNLILQPIVENAIRHGVADRETNGRIEIQATRQNGWLDLRVRDNGPGIMADAQASLKPGVGLQNTRARLEQLFGPAHRFELKNANGGGLEVVIAIPFREEKPSGENLKQ